MRYHHLIARVSCEPWAIHRDYAEFYLALLAARATGAPDPELSARLTQRREEEARKGEGMVAVLPIHGTIAQRMGMMEAESGGVSTEALAARFRAAVADPGVKAILLHLDSPGGTTYGVGELAAEILEARGGTKPIIAQVDSLAASAAYWLAAAADEIVVTPGGYAGSVGVYSLHRDMSEALAKAGVKMTLIASDVNKGEGLPYFALSDEARASLQERVDHANAQFVGAVAAGRRVSQAVVRDTYGRGRVFPADKLVSLGMADRIGTMQDTLARLGVVTQPRKNAVGAMRAHLQEMAAAGTLTVRAYEQALRDAAPLSNAMAEVFASLAPHVSQGEPGKSKPAQEVKAKALADQLRSTRFPRFS